MEFGFIARAKSLMKNRNIHPIWSLSIPDPYPRLSGSLFDSWTQVEGYLPPVRWTWPYWQALNACFELWPQNHRAELYSESGGRVLRHSLGRYRQSDYGRNSTHSQMHGGENHQDLCNRRSRGKGEQWVKNLATMPEVFLVCKNCLPASPYLPLAAPPPTVFGWLPLAFSQKPSLSSPPGATLPSLHSYSFSWLILQYSWALCWHVTPFMKVFLTTFFPR